MDRRNSIVGQLNDQNIEYEIFNAVEGEDGYDFFTEVSDRKFLINTGRLPQNDEIGSYASHLYLWNLCVALETPLIVVEDDAIFQSDVAIALNVASNWIGRFGFICLQKNTNSTFARRRTAATASGVALQYCERYPFGTLAYAISPKVASAFIRASKTILGPVDWFIKQTWIHRQPIYSLDPGCVVSGEVDCPNAEDYSPTNPSNVGVTALRAVSKMRRAMSRAIFNYQYLRQLDL